MDGQNFNNENVTVESTSSVESTPYVSESSNEIPVYQASVDSGEASSSEGKGLAIAGLVCGIISLASCCCTCLIVVGIAGLVCSIISNKKNPSGMAKAGIICSSIGIVGAVIYWILSAALGLADYTAILDQYGY